MAATYVFHQIGKEGPFTISPERLARWLHMQLDAGKRPSSSPISSRSADAVTFSITFDDANKSILTLGLPILEDLGIKATLFVPTAFVGSNPEFLTWKELSYLKKLGWTIGSHTVTHPRLCLRLYSETETDYRQRLIYEIAHSKKVLEEKLGEPIDLFSYPYGDVNLCIKTLVSDCGYIAGFSIGNGSAEETDPFEIPRMDISIDLSSRPEEEVKGISVVIPAHNRKEILEESLFRLKSQSFPAGKFEVLVVDDASEERLEDCVNSFGGNFNYYRLPDAEKQFNAALARNTGAILAKFPILQFLDSDILVDEDFLWAVSWVHQNFKKAICLGYLSGYNLESQGYRHCLKDIKGKPLASVNIIPERSREPALRSCLDNIQTLNEPWRLCYTGNLSISRENFLDAGSFQQSFSGWGLEDIEFGYRCYERQLTWLFSRYAIGYHLESDDETNPRNPFRLKSPDREAFSQYQANLERLKALHPISTDILKFYHQSVEDIENILCGDDTVGVHFASAESATELPLEEIRDRILFAKKTKAGSLYFLGGEPCEHLHFLPVLHYAKIAGFRISAETNGVIFSKRGFGNTAFEAGLSTVVLIMYSFTEDIYRKITQSTKDEFLAFLHGYEYLKRANKIIRIKLIINSFNEHELEDILCKLSWLESNRIEIVRSHHLELT